MPSQKTNQPLRSRLLIAAMLPIPSYSLLAAEAARVEFTSGSAVAVTATGVQRSLSKGAILEPGETVRTAANARAQLRFTDGGMVSLQPDTEFRIDEYTFNASEPGKEKGFFSLVRGGLRTITGLIGRSTRSNYQVNTTVATIGIRGTEYSALFTGGTDGTLSLATGEGIVEICNAGGCVTVAGGEAAIVTGANSQPRRTAEPPTLPPTKFDALQSGNVFSTAESRRPDGSISPVSAALPSGSGYELAMAGMKGGSPYQSALNNVTATLTTNAELTDATDAGGTTIKTQQVESSFTRDGTIAWGRWKTGQYVQGSSVALSDFHYIVGVPTPSPQMPVSGVATFQLAGYTVPTASNGLSGGRLTGQISYDFGQASGNLSLTSTGNAAFSISSLALSGSGNTFSGSDPNNSVNGFFTGANANGMALSYKHQNGGVYYMGVAAFQR